MGATSPEGAPRRALKPTNKRGIRVEQGKAREAARTAALSPSSRARALAAVCRDVAGSEGPGPVVPPVPMSIACECHGLHPETIREELERGLIPELREARAKGRAMAARLACGPGPEARQWAWLAERLAPRELHLPTRVTGVAAEDGGAPIATAALTVTLVEARALARDDYDGPIRALPEGTGGR